MQRITAIKLLDKRKQAFLIDLDGRPWSEIDIEVVVKMRLHEGDDLKREQLEQIERENEYVLARRRAVNFCVKQPRTEREVMRMFQRKKMKPQTIERVLRELHRQQMLRDRDVARRGVRKAERSHMGPLKTQAELKQRGVPAEVIEEEISPVRDREWQKQQATELARKRLLRLERLDVFTQKRRLADYLLRRGFEGEVVQDIIEDLFDR